MSKHDNVKHPSHYNTGDIEVFDYICDKLSAEELRGYIKGNVLKYVSRERHKGGDEDLRKAEWYLSKYLERTNEYAPIADQCSQSSQKPTDLFGTDVTPLRRHDWILKEQKEENTTLNDAIGMLGKRST